MSESTENLTPINGSGVLGAGINLYGPFDGTLLRQIYDMAPGTETKGLPVSAPKQYFAIPQNARIKDTGSGNSYSKSYSTREEYDSHFSASVSAKGSYLGFSASAEASFTRDVTNKTSSSFGVLTFNSNIYELELKEDGMAALAVGLKNDPDYINLPSTYNPAEPAAFLRFFRKFGTHFVSSVQMGGRLNYNVAVRSSSSFTSEEVKAKLTAEYNGVFAKGGASAEAEFKKADKKWFDSTQRYVSTMGGNNEILAAVIPTVNENHNEAFKMWLASVAAGDTAVLSLQVRSIDTIFDKQRSPAVRAALQDYRNQYVQVNVSELTGRVQVAGTDVRPDLFNQPVSVGPNYSGIGRLEVAVLHPETLAVIYANSWTPNWVDRGKVEFFAPALKELNHYKNTNYIVVVAIAAIITARNLVLKDGLAFADFLRANCGAGTNIKDYFENQPSGSDGPPNTRTNYGLISTFGTNHPAIERYAEPPKMHVGSFPTQFPDPLALYAFLNPYTNDQGKVKYSLSEMGLPPLLVKGSAQPTAEGAADEAEAEQEALA